MTRRSIRELVRGPGALVSGCLLAGLLVLPISVAAPPGGFASGSDTVTVLVEEVQRLRDELEVMRRDLAAAQLREREKDRELNELRQFIDDHHEFGRDFLQYRAVKQAAERDARRKAADQQRKRREAARAQRQARVDQARRDRDQRKAEEEWEDRYRDAGFASLGLDVFGGRMAYSYKTRERNPVRIDYDPFIGLYYRPGGPTTEIDFRSMTISGSVLNAAAEVRNIGVAITFFDESGNQVGGEIIRINNARPDVPYPFTSTLEIALDRPFSSSSTYVLYADAVAP